jgi:hypothetical protein
MEGDCFEREDLAQRGRISASDLRLIYATNSVEGAIAHIRSKAIGPFGLKRAHAAAFPLARRAWLAGRQHIARCSLLRELHSHLVGAGRGASFTHHIPVPGPAGVAGGIDIATIVRRCHDQHSIAVDVNVG